MDLDLPLHVDMPPAVHTALALILPHGALAIDLDLSIDSTGSRDSVAASPRALSVCPLLALLIAAIRSLATALPVVRRRGCRGKRAK